MTIPRKLKPCKSCLLPKYLWARGMCKECDAKAQLEGGKATILSKQHNVQMVDISTLRKVKTPNKKKSKKQIARDALYYPIAKKFKEDNPICQARIEGHCTGKTVDVHHKVSREGDYLFNTEFFLSVCRECHEYLHRNPTFGYANGFLIKRI